MSLMQWDRTMSIGMEELDEQHRQLIELINEAYEAIQRHDEHRMTELIDMMRDYSKVHFATEEAYFKKHNFPNVDEHKQQHDKFNQDTLEFQKKAYGGTNLSQIFVYLSRWLTTHIMDEDMKYANLIAQVENQIENTNEA